MHGPDAATLAVACAGLAARDPALDRALREVGVPTWRRAEPSFETLARAVVSQLISIQAADAIWSRVRVGLSGEVTGHTILDCDAAAMRAWGLSRPKAAHLQAIAQALSSGDLDLVRLQTSDLDDARAELLAVRGIGPWTAELFLMTALGHIDAFPAADAGIMEAYRRLCDAPVRLDAKAFAANAERWRPFRGVGAHLLWSWLHHDRTRHAALRAGQARRLS